MIKQIEAIPNNKFESTVKNCREFTPGNSKMFVSVINLKSEVIAIKANNIKQTLMILRISDILIFFITSSQPLQLIQTLNSLQQLSNN